MPSTLQANRSQVTIAKIMEAAEGLFLQKHYAEVTIDQIAEAASITKGAVYHHFSSKENLYLSMMHGHLAEKSGRLKSAGDCGKTCRNRLHNLTKTFFDMPADKRNLILLVRRDINIFQGDVRAELVRAYQAALPELVQAIFEKGMADGELAPADPRLLAWQFVALVEVTLADYADQVFQNPEDKLEHVLDLFFYGAGTVLNPEKK